MAEPKMRHWSASIRSRCPECDGQLTVLRVINGRGGAEYWAMQCMVCHGVHLDIVEPPTRH